MVSVMGRLVAGLALTALACGVPHDAEATPGEATPSEYEVKAVYLFNFARFVEWPATVFNAPDASFTICVLGIDPFGSFLDGTLAGEQIDGRRLVARRITRPADAADCHILFASTTHPTRLPEILVALGGRPVLTVGDDETFSQGGGMVGFRLEQNTVRFTVNPAVLRRAGLTMSSQLLRLARIVSTEP